MFLLSVHTTMYYGVLVQCLFHGRVSGFLRSLRRSHSLFGQHGGRSLLVKISLRRLHVDRLVLFVLMQWGEGGSFIYKLYLHGNCGVFVFSSFVTKWAVLELIFYLVGEIGL